MARKDPLLGVRLPEHFRNHLIEMANARGVSLQRMVEAVLREAFDYGFDFDTDEFETMCGAAEVALLRGVSPVDAIVAVARPEERDLATTVALVLRHLDYRAIINDLARQGAEARQKLPGKHPPAIKVTSDTFDKPEGSQ